MTRSSSRAIPGAKPVSVLLPPGANGTGNPFRCRMTIIMYLLAHGAQTPVMMWLIAMLCDTAIIITVLLTKIAP